MSTVSTDSQRDKIRQVETFPQPSNEKRQLPKPPARGSPLPSAWGRGGRLRRGWKRKAAIKPPFPWLNHPSPGSCTSSQLACTIPNSVPGPWVGGSGDAMPGLHFSLLQTAQGKGEKDETSIAQIPQGSSQQQPSSSVPWGWCPGYRNPWLWHSFCQHSLPSLRAKMQAASNTLLCSLANPYPESMSTQVHNS